MCNINFWIENEPSLPPPLELFQKIIRFGSWTLPLPTLQNKVMKVVLGRFGGRAEKISLKLGEIQVLPFILLFFGFHPFHVNIIFLYKNILEAWRDTGFIIHCSFFWFSFENFIIFNQDLFGITPEMKRAQKLNRWSILLIRDPVVGSTVRYEMMKLCTESVWYLVVLSQYGMILANSWWPSVREPKYFSSRL